MDTTFALDRQHAAATPRVVPSRLADDKAMLRAAAELTRDLIRPRPALYWADMIGSAAIGYAALVLAATTASTAVAIVAGIVSALALYRAISFIHEISHLKNGALPHFRAGWNALVGVPMLTPSFMYEGVHNLHHVKTRYGTSEDPEYLPLALMKPWTLPLFILVSALAPAGLLIRFGILSPLSLVVPGFRRVVVERYSALAINPHFRRRLPEGEDARRWVRVEAAASVWAIALLALVATGTVSLRAFLIGMAIFSVVAVMNQVRTLVAHLWKNEGEQMSVTAQYLDSVNVPPPGYLPMLWAPVGLRYHALHHLLPSLPYHSLGEAHRRLSAALDPSSPFHKASYKSASGLMLRITRSTLARGR
ncbi:fatty acid desaturase family protein [Sphingomonas aracearum]|uniref:Fatty acid desaturase n=1 Tax=Sphingomonas aracearum TaxID=2283317 RepID=A0A369VWD2_9SPHN|nr:fatty acid desaturase [Sphingomonas aracearum]RDE06648.1 fatty acid desaturase [Sphingomonas aracearum]